MNQRLEKYRELLMKNRSESRLKHYAELLNQIHSDAGRSRHAGRDRKQKC
jgi:hypothetical protein